jgi:short chain dehydrogenase
MASTPLRIDASVAIVTGSGSGIGGALALAFAAAGAQVVVDDINDTAANETTDLICIRGQAAVAMEADASVNPGIRALIDLAHKEFGSVDIYVANAGVAGPPGMGSGEDEWDYAIAYGDNGIGVRCVCPIGVNTALLKSALKSPDGTEQPAAHAIINAAEVIDPDRVASVTLDAVRNGRFLALPHPQVIDVYRRKSLDYEGWIDGMRRYQGSIAPETSNMGSLCLCA